MKSATLPYKVGLAFVFALLGACYIIFLTKDVGMGISIDSASYMEISRNIMNAKGATVEQVDGSYVLFTHRPPMYPYAVALFSRIGGVGEMQGARILSVFLFFGSILLFNLILSFYKTSNIGLLVLNLLFFISYYSEVFLMIWSEPLFLFMLLLSLYLLMKYFETGQVSLIALSGFLMGGMFVCRYAVVSFIGAFAGSIFLFDKSNFWGRIKRVSIWSLSSLIIILLWVAYSYLNVGNPTNREMEFHPISFDHIRGVVSVMSHWFSPIYPKFTGLAFFIAGSALLAWNYRALREIARFSNFRFWVPTTVVLVYFVFLVLSISFFDFHTQLNNRILSPIGPFILLSLFPIANYIYSRGGAISKKTLTGLIAIALVSNLIFFAERSVEFRQSGILIANYDWNESPTLEYLAKVAGEEDLIYSNGREIIITYSDRRSGVADLPGHLDPVSQSENDKFDSEIGFLRSSLEQKKSIVVYFDHIQHRYYLPTKEELISRFEEMEFVHLDDGMIILPKE